VLRPARGASFARIARRIGKISHSNAQRGVFLSATPIPQLEPDNFG
jgi:hypothetical protein